MNKLATNYSILYHLLGGGGLGGLLGAGANKLQKKKLNSSGNILLGAGLGSLAGLLRYSLLKPRLSKIIDDTKELKDRKLPEGLYYGDRPVAYHDRLLQDLPIMDRARHSFLVGVFNKKPAGIQVQKLPNDQYVATFTGLTNNNNFPKETSFTDLYFTYNGKTGVPGVGNPADFNCVKAYVEPEGDYVDDTDLYLLEDNKKKYKKLVKQLVSMAKKERGHSYGKYRVVTPRKNNCISTVASMLSGLDIDRSKLPERLGDIGGVNRDEIDDYHNVIFRDKDDTTTA